MTILQAIRNSNVALACCMDRAEQTRARDATHLNTRSHIQFPLSHSSHLGSPTANLNHIDVVDLVGDPMNISGSNQDQGKSTVSF